jgi:hypothetical protein
MEKPSKKALKAATNKHLTRFTTIVYPKFGAKIRLGGKKSGC